MKQKLLDAGHFLHRILGLCPRIYDARQPMQWRRMVSFVARALSHPHRIRALLRFFEAQPPQPLLHEILQAHPGLIEQAVRSFFYAGSSTAERAQLIQQHFTFLLQRVCEPHLRQIYLQRNLMLWQQDSFTLRLLFHRGAGKEGLISASLQCAERALYQATFWFAPLPDAAQGYAAWIGALQGAPESLIANRDFTKQFHGYRPQNLILRAVRLTAQAWGAGHLLAISDTGFYANRLLRLDRKLKTSMNKLWSECGGTPHGDARFYLLPLTEPRKSESEIPANKRALYRRRFAWLDAFDASVQAALCPTESTSPEAAA